MATLQHKQQAPASSSTRNRSFGGCATCRSRHTKCDEGRPTCSMCQYFGLICGGYEKNIFFNFENAADDSIIRFRRPLLTEGERKSMSQWLTSTVPPKTAHRLLSQIDTECENAGFSQELQISRGPFGAFRLIQNQSALNFNPLLDESEEFSPTQALVLANDESFVSLESTMSPWTQDLIQSIFEQSDPIPSSPAPDFSDMMIDSGHIQEDFDSIPMPEVQDFSTFQRTSSDFEFPQLVQCIQLSQSMPPSYLSSLTTVNNTVPQDAVFLLKHCVTTIISSLTPFQDSKTPWHILFLPQAKNCLAALTLGEHLDHASLSAFYGTLAISAFSLAGISQSQIWVEQGRGYKQRSREHIRLMLQTAHDFPKVAKYKSILIALVTMVQISIFSGNRDQTECYLLQAEKFIRLKGLKRKKSRKVRLLHHCYAYMRIFHESTFILGMDSGQRHHVRKAIESSGLVIYGQDSLSFCRVGWENLDQEMTKVKGQEEGENDLHLEKPGLFSATLYPEIYGVPEEWMLLLSQVIRLGNEKDAAEQQDKVSSMNLKDFVNRAKAIERCINRLQRPSQTTSLSANNQPRMDQHIMENMLDAMRCGLSIYFYRRIYDVDASMLQQKVLHVRDCLSRGEQAVSSVVYVSAGFIWTAFIAACEAEDPEMQASFSNWFKTSAERTGLSHFTDTLKTVEQVWQEKRGANGKIITWLDLMKKNVSLQQLL